MTMSVINTRSGISDRRLPPLGSIPSPRSQRGFDPNKGAMVRMEGRGNSSGGTRMSLAFDGQVTGYRM